jgi:HEAT repeat protein
MGSSMKYSVLLAVVLPAALVYGQDKAADDVTKVKDSVTNRDVADLVKALSIDETERAIAEGELVRRGKSATTLVVGCLQAAESPTEARVSAARILRKIKDPAAIPALLDVYKNQGAPLPVRGESALALGDLEAVNAIPDLIEGLANNMFKVSETARTALIMLGPAAVDGVVDAYKREMAVPENPKAKEKEREAYAARDGLVYRSLLILGDLGGPKAREALKEALKVQKGSRAIGVRHHAGLAMGLLRYSDKEYKLAIEPLLESYEVERDLSVAGIFVRSLEWLTDAHDVPPQPYRWKAWWNVNRDKILGTEDHAHEHIELPKDGLKKGDSLEEPKDTPPPPK